MIAVFTRLKIRLLSSGLLRRRIARLGAIMAHSWRLYESTESVTARALLRMSAEEIAALIRELDRRAKIRNTI